MKRAPSAEPVVTPAASEKQINEQFGAQADAS
jgi:hypothetical protein